MAIDFPASPTVDQVFTTAEGAWQWDGTKWTAQTLFVPQGNANVFISDTAPASPEIGDLWYDSVGAQLYVWYSDANSTQWVVVVNQNSASLLLSGGTMTGPLILSGGYYAADVNMARYRNRIMNGDISLDQRNNGAQVALVGITYVVDRWKFSTNVTPSKGNAGQTALNANSLFSYTYCLSWSTATAYPTLAAGDAFQIYQGIEGCNFNDANFGTANALPITLEFWAASNVAGTFSGALRNGVANRSYIFNFNLVAGIWTKIRVTIPGDTVGTWNVANNAVAAFLGFSFGTGSTYSTSAGSWTAGNFLADPTAVSILGTVGNYFNITGVSLMIGASAKNAEPQFKSYADNLLDCQRYYQTGQAGESSGCISWTAGWGCYHDHLFPVRMRVSPTMAVSNLTQSNCSNTSVAGTTYSYRHLYNITATANGVTSIASWTADADF